MLPKLSNSEKLVSELKFFEAKSKSLSEDDQKYIKKRIIRIKELSNNIDNAHDVRLNGFVSPSLIGDSRLELNQARYEIFKKLQD